MLQRAVLLFAALVLLPQWALAESFTLDLGQGGGVASRIVQFVALVTILSLAPSILIMVTSFTRIVVVLSFLRSALGLQQTPPNPVLVGLALFLTLFVMQPVFMEAYENGVKPLMDEKINEEKAFDEAVKPFHLFMMKHVREKDLALFVEMAGGPKIESPEATPLRILIPAFMISELRRAFEIGFLIFVPFLIIDMVVASILMAMGMMMLPPVVVSLPFKLVFFVLVDGWYMVCGSLVKSFGG